MRHVNDETLALIKQWEGLRLNAYRDVGGVLTIGYGHTGPDVVEGMEVTEGQADALLRGDLREAESAVERLVVVPLTDGQFGALVSFVFNVGAGAFSKSTLLQRLNAGDYAAVPEQLGRWVYVDKRPVDGLANRRAAEAGLWARGSFVSSNTIEPAPEPPAKPIMQRPETYAVGTAVGGSAAVAGSTLTSAGQGLMWGGDDWFKLIGTILVLGGVVLTIVLVMRKT